MALITSLPLLGIDHVVIRVRDLDSMLDFYTTVLGCELAKHNEALDLWHLRVGNGLIDLVPVDGVLGKLGGATGDTAPPAASGRNMDHVALKVHPFDADALLDYLKSHGIEARATLQTRFGAEGNGPSIQFRDPEGNGIELKSC
ncbi:VOC family protein [Synechococcus sp. UW105]|uniref:VOC family protein n=1 Tax=unclassified Synechococcus TaxID=2626047 RepID=UPI000E0F595A|nr:VOC family protein [Synechococcus sp. UW105]